MGTDIDPNLVEHWGRIRAAFRKSFASSFHYAIASVDPDGNPHVTPIGSLLLNPDEPSGVYFEIFTTQLRKNVEANPNVCVLAVNSSRRFWLGSLLRGRFPEPPALRLHGVAGPRRAATPEEVRRWQRRLGPILWLKGSQLLWGKLAFVREIRFHRMEKVSMGKMTSEPAG